VLVAGGVDINVITASAELYSPATGTWLATAAMHHARAAHTGTLLKDGRVLIAGGLEAINGGVGLTTAEVYDPTTSIWSETGDMLRLRAFHAAALLPDGTVLVAGSIYGSADAQAAAEIYNPVSGTWSATASMANSRGEETATVLADGNVLVVGGIGSSGTAIATSELYDPAHGAWHPAGTLVTERGEQTSTLLRDGRVLVAGGDVAPPRSPGLATAEVYR